MVDELILDDGLKRVLIEYIRSDDSKKVAEFVKLCESGLITEDLMLKLGDVIPYHNKWKLLYYHIIQYPLFTSNEWVKIAISYYMKVVLGWDRVVKGSIEFSQVYSLIVDSYVHGWMMAYFKYNYTGVHYQLLKSYKCDVDDEELAICLIQLYKGANLYNINGFRDIIELEQVIYNDIMGLGLYNKRVHYKLKYTCKDVCEVLNGGYKGLIISLSSETYYNDLVKRWDDVYNSMILVDV